MLSACAASARALTWKTVGSSSPAILYILGIISKSPWLAVYVVVSAPAHSEPCTAPAAPASDCISARRSFCPNMFTLPAADHSSATSAIGEEGVIG